MGINYSIIIPHKNIPQLLNRCLASIPYREDIQIIVIDDNSDSSIITPKDFPGKERKNIEIYFSNASKGAGYARNIGLDHAKGKWIIFADADDFFTDEFLPIIDQYLNSSYDVILFPVNTVESDNINIKVNRDSWINQTLQEKQLTAQEKLLKISTPHSKLIRHSCIKANHLYFEEVIYSNDVMFGTQLAIAAQSIHIDNNHSIYTLTFRSGSLTTIKGKEALRCRLQVSIRSNLYLKKHNHPELMLQLNQHFLQWAGNISTKEVILTAWHLLKNGFLLYSSPHSWKYKYYNSGWYYVYKALIKKRHK